MKKLRCYTFLLIGSIGLILILSGCTRSIYVTYTADMPRLSNADALNKLSLGVAKFDDKRAWVDNDDPKSESYVAMQSPWKFGITYDDKDYMPIKDIVQAIFVKELINAGVNARPIDLVLHKQNMGDVLKNSSQYNTDYILGGEVIVFEFVNDAGVWIVTSRRTVALNFILVKVNGEEVRLDTAINETDRENEGMGVRHATNVDKLLNKAVKKVVHQVIEQVAAKMSASNINDISWRIAVNGKTYDFSPILL